MVLAGPEEKSAFVDMLVEMLGAEVCCLGCVCFHVVCVRKRVRVYGVHAWGCIIGS